MTYGQARQKLWDHLEVEHGLLVLDSELDEIIDLAVAVNEAKKVEDLKPIGMEENLK